MRTKALLLLSVLTLFAGGCASVPKKSETPAPERKAHAASSRYSGLVVISAVYGSGKNFVDVSSRFYELVSDPDGEYFARPEWLHADPTPGWNKALIVVYEFKGKRHLLTVGEGGPFSAERLLQNAKGKPKARGR